MTTTEAEPVTPFYLQGNFAPVRDEVTATDLPVEGDIPADLAGRYLRNGPNPRGAPPRHWFLGDGMLHGIELYDGRARWYRNRWVRTKAFRGEGRYVDEAGRVDLTYGPANTHVVAHAGRILALVESSFPTAVTPALDTVGIHDFGARLTTAMTAHPKIDPVSGEMLFFGYGFLPPYLTYHVVDASGALIRSEGISVPGPTMIHDFAVTETHVVWMDLPVVFDLGLAVSGELPYRWDDGYGARLGVMPRAGGDADVHWFEIEPCYVFHPMNAYDGDGRVVLDVVRYDHLFRRDGNDFPPASLWQWTIDVDAGSVTEAQIDDAPIEFPRVDERRVGRPYRFGYAVETAGDVARGSRGVLRYDRRTGEVARAGVGRGRQPGEVVFVPAGEGAAEDEGWLMTFVYDPERDTSDFVVLDAVTLEPAATVALPQRVPAGFHGSWIAD